MNLRLFTPRSAVTQYQCLTRVTTQTQTLAGYFWQLGWAFQDAWQLVFVRQTVWGMWLAALCLIGALCSFLTALVRLNGTTHELRAQVRAGSPPAFFQSQLPPTCLPKKA